MELQNEVCNVKISIDEMYTVDSTDNKFYDLILNPGSYKHSDMYKVFSIEIINSSGEIRLALVGDFYSYDTDCAVLEDEVLTVLQNDSIIQIDINNGSLLLSKKFDCFGCNFGIFKVKKGYIIFGEMEILMLDFEFNRKWAFSGKDIFVSTSGNLPFELCENSIKLYDFENNYYEIDYMGNLIMVM